MPLVDVSHDDTVSEADLRRLAENLPAVVAAAVDCAEEPWRGEPEVGDIELRFHPRAPSTWVSCGARPR